MTFDETELAELAASIKAHGVLQPIVVRPTYEAKKRSSHGVIHIERTTPIGMSRKTSRP